MFRALLCSSSGGQIVLHSIWYRHTETSEWSKITKIQFYKYEHIVVKVIYEFFGCDYCTFLHYKHVMSCRGYVYLVVKRIKDVLSIYIVCLLSLSSHKIVQILTVVSAKVTCC